MTDKTKTEQDAAEQPQALVGSGAPQVKVRANVNYQNLKAGQVGFVDNTNDVKLDIANGYLEAITEK